ncbi:AMP-binding enzyme [Actinomyces faecalis]|uniref:AMP-binding enzyme n=1 Tax=Actinomyces faecalis TaxID=2722820 RepID=UPI001FD52ABD|nr:AMP-binding protein [Actinomyces faecalis]
MPDPLSSCAPTRVLMSAAQHEPQLAERRLELLPGGTGPAEVAALYRALAARLAMLTGPVAGSQPGLAEGAQADSGVETVEASQAAPVVGPATGPVTISQAQEPASSPLLVPVAPDEDKDALRRRLNRILRGVPPRADLLLRTSGSTRGHGSIVAMSAAALAASAQATDARLAGPGCWVLALPAHHVAGLQVLVRSALSGHAPSVVDTRQGFRPQALADGLEEALQVAGRTPVYTSLVPTQLLRCLENPRATALLARTSAVLVGGAATDPVLYRRALARGLRVVRTYGMSETGGGCVYDGRPLDGVSVRIQDPDVDSVGRIVLAGPVLAEACWEGSSVLRRRPDGGVELLTSDRGRLDGGVLTVLGRVDDVIVTGGVKVEPRVVEEAMTGLPGVAQCCVVGVADARWGAVVVAVVVPHEHTVVDPEALRQAARARLDGAHSPKRVVLVDELPERGPGKVDRRAVAVLATHLSAQAITAPTDRQTRAHGAAHGAR